MVETASVDEYSHFFEVRLDLFDGPIDLLLHLVKQKELPLEKLSLSAVTEQYLACIERAQQFDLEIAGEYLVIAATLLSIKSSILLDEPVELVEDDEGNLLDPHEELLRKLREAEIYKQGAFMLSCRKLLNLDVFSPPSVLPTIEPPPVRYKNHDPILLGIAFKRLLDRAPKSLGLTITMDSVSIVERMMAVIGILKAAKGPVEFTKLIPDLTSRGVIIGSFCALLELCKRQAIHIKQDEIFKEIYVALSSGDFDTTGMTSEFDAAAAEAASGITING